MSLLVRVVLIIGVALLPPLAMHIFNAATLRAARQADVREEALREAQAVAAELRWITGGVRSALITVAENPAVRDGDAAACGPVLQALRESFPALHAVSLRDEGGRLLCGSGEAVDAAGVRLARERGSVAFGSFVREPDSGLGVLPVAYPVRGRPGAGPILVGGIDLGWLAAQLAFRRLPPDSTLSVADCGGTVLVHLPNQALAGQKVPPDYRSWLAAAAPAVLDRRGPDGKERATGFVPPSEASPDLFVAVGLSTERAFAATDAAAARGYALITASFLAAIALAAGMARNFIARPVQAILATTERWQAGDIGARVASSQGRSEFGRIARAVNDLLAAVAAGQTRLQERLAELRAIYDGSPVGLGFVDRALRYVTVNTRLAEINGVAEAKHRGRTVREVLPHAAHRLEPLLLRALHGERLPPRDVETGTEGEPGPRRRLVVSYQPAVAPGGDVLGVVVAIQEVTALRRTEAALAAALQQANVELERRVAERTSQLEAEVREREAAQAQLQQAQRMEVIGQLAGGVAHDFNNLLTAIIGNLELAAARSFDRPEVARLLGGAIRSADRGAALTQRMLAFGRRQILRPQPVSMHALLEGMAELIGHTIGPAVQVRIHAPATLAPARADPHQLELVVLNLVLNARDAMPDGGTITVTVDEQQVASGRVHPAGLMPGAYLRLAVADTGAGMDAATQARAFEPFYTTKPVGRGSGLGLPMVQGVAAQSGGGVAIASTPGHGTTVCVWFPCAEAASVPAPPPPAAALDDGAGREVLVVDDDADIAAFTATCLEDAGYRVRCAGDGAAALLLLQFPPPPDLLIADLGMPGLNGRQLAAAARRLYPLLPILIATGYAADDVRLPGEPDLPLLGKPFKAADLLVRVAALLCRQPSDAEPV